MALLPGLKGTAEGGDSRRSAAVANFLVPVTLAWLLTVAGLLWGKELLDPNNLAVGVGAAAFLTVILSALQDVVPERFKQWLLFPRDANTKKITWPNSGNHLPSYCAFEDKMLKKANFSESDIAAMDKLNPKAQDDRWYAGYLAHRESSAVGQFSARHIAWRDLMPVLFLLLTITIFIGVVVGFSTGWSNVWPWVGLSAATGFLLALSWLAGRSSNIALVVQVLLEMHKSPTKKREKRPAIDVYLIRQTRR